MAYEDEHDTSENIEPEVADELSEADSTEEVEEATEEMQQDPASNE